MTEPETTRVTLLPRFSRAWVALVLVAVAALGFGVFSYAQEFHHEVIATSLRTPGHGGASWGLYIAFDVFFVGVSFTGIAVVALTRLFNIARLRPVSRLSLLLAVSGLLGAGTAVIADLGRPIHGLLKLPRFANPASPFFGTFTVVMASFLFSALVYLFLAGRPDAARLAQDPTRRGRFFYRIWASGFRDLPVQRLRHSRMTFIIALVVLPLAAIAQSTLALIFGIQGGRPGWFSALQPPFFIALAAMSGIGMLILIGAGLRRLLGLRDQLPDETFRLLGNVLWILSLVCIYFLVVEELTASYAAPLAERALTREMLTGAFAPAFWTTVGSFLIALVVPFLMFTKRRVSIPWLCAAAVFANVATVGKRLLVIVPSQTHGALLPIDSPRMYVPDWSEFGVVAGIFGLIGLILLGFVCVFPLVPLPASTDPAPTLCPREPIRRAIATVVAVLAAGLIVIGLADSFRVFSADEIDPRIPYSPILFAIGVILLFGAAVVYELLPPRRETPTTFAEADALPVNSINPLTKRGET